MAYQNELGLPDWFGFTAPLAQAAAGQDLDGFDLLQWEEDDPLDPWSDWHEQKMEREARTALGAPRRVSDFNVSGVATPEQLQQIVLPRATTAGDGIADRRAAQVGVNPGRRDGGAGHILDLARSQVGTQYVWGAVSPDVAFDCSGFVKWIYQRALGITLPHQSTAQAKQLQKVGRDDLQPGDAVFFSYGRLGEGVIDHVEIYMGDGKMIGTANTTDDLDVDQVDWEHFVQGGRATGVAVAPVKAPPGQAGRAGRQQDISLAPLALADGVNPLSTILGTLLAPEADRKRMAAPSGRGPQGSIKKQLHQGFMDAGRPDLAAMVGTKDFDTWVKAESGYRPDVTSQYFEGHGVNYGLFQFWEGHDWTQQYIEGGEWSASPYEQAKLVVKYFDLTPQDIHTYADQVRAGTYRGWG